MEEDRNLVLPYGVRRSRHLYGIAGIDYCTLDIYKLSKPISLKIKRKLKIKKKMRGFFRLVKKYSHDDNLIFEDGLIGILFDASHSCYFAFEILDYLSKREILDKNNVEWYPDEITKLRDTADKYFSEAENIILELLMESLVKYRDDRLIKKYKENMSESDKELYKKLSFTIDDVIDLKDSLVNLKDILLYEEIYRKADEEISVEEAKELLINKVSER